MKKISVIIPSCNRVELLSNCLDRLLRSIMNVTESNCEVIVTDDSSNDLTLKLIETKYSWVTWTQGPRRGPAANRNNGANLAVGDWLIFLDDDCLPHPDWFAAYNQTINTTKFKILEGKTDVDRPKERYDEESPINLTGNRLWSCNFAIEKYTFDKIEGFDETFPYAAMEDIDFYNRSRKYSQIFFLPSALVIHPWRKVMPFRSFNKHIHSIKHYLIKNPKKNKLTYFWQRIKIFIGTLIGGLFELKKYSFRGWKFYLEKCLLNLILIFV